MAVPGAGVAGGHGTDLEDVAGRGGEERRRESEMRVRYDGDLARPGRNFGQKPKWDISIT